MTITIRVVMVVIVITILAGAGGFFLSTLIPDDKSVPITSTVTSILTTMVRGQTTSIVTVTETTIETSTSLITFTITVADRIQILKVETVAERLEVPWSIDFSPDGKIFFTERVGRIGVIDRFGATPKTLIELPVAHVGEGGLLGLALHPSYPERPYLYVYYTYSDGRELWNRIVRIIVEDGQGREDAVLIDHIPGASIHNGGRVKFGPDGKLYITTGDAANPELSQDLNSLAGKILRINSDGSIPEDNPFKDSPIYSYGHRNPQGLAWHPVTKRLYITEHGPVGYDEINIVEAGKNYGWPEVKGVADRAEYIDPISVYTPSIAPSGATFYDSDIIGEWRYNFFFATLRGRHLHRMVLNSLGEGVDSQQLLLEGEFGRLRDVVVGPDGFLYIATSNLDGRGSPHQNDDRILRIRLLE